MKLYDENLFVDLQNRANLGLHQPLKKPFKQ